MVHHEPDWKSQFNTLMGAVASLAPYDGLGHVLDRRIAAADKLRKLAATSGQRSVSKFADQIAGPPECVADLESFDTAYQAYKPFETLAGIYTPPAEDVAALRNVIGLTLTSQPRGPFELGRKVMVACIYGAHRKLQHAWRQPGLDAGNQYRLIWRELSAIEPWFLAQVAGYEYSLAECEFGRRGGSFIVGPGFIDELLEFAGHGWRAAIDADVKRLNARAGVGEAV